MAKAKKTGTKDVFKKVTDTIIKMLEGGTIPWRRPWGDSGVDTGMPVNYLTRKYYRGINVIMLYCEAMDKGYALNYWLTAKQAKQLGGTILKGETPVPVIYWMPIAKKEAKVIDKKKKRDNKKAWIRRIYFVYNVAQTTGIRVDAPEAVATDKEFDPIAEAEAVIEAWDNRPEIRYGGNGASYNRAMDLIRMPAKKSFKSREHLYATLFHEGIHSTGHNTRLGRFDKSDSKIQMFGDEAYSKEELVAEAGSAFICAALRIDNSLTIENTVAYIQSWLKALKNNREWLIAAFSQGDAAANYILNGGKVVAKETVKTIRQARGAKVTDEAVILMVSEGHNTAKLLADAIMAEYAVCFKGRASKILNRLYKAGKLTKTQQGASMVYKVKTAKRIKK